MDKLIFLYIFTLTFFCEIINARILQKRNVAVDDKCTSICSSTDCADAAKSLIENMDESISPCDDFYHFVCGNYIKRNKIANDKVSVDQLNTVQDKVDKQLLNSVKAEVLPSDLQAFKKLKIHYKNCLDEAEIEKLGATPLLNLLKRLGGWPLLLGDEWKEEDYKWENVVSSISKEGFNPDFPISVFVGLDSTNSQKYSLKISSASNMIYDPADEKFIEAYQHYLVEIVVLLGADRERANREMKDLAQLPIDQLADVSRLENRKTISVLSKEHPELPWLDVINRILSPSNVTVTENEFVEIHDPKFISEVGLLLKNIPKRVLANHQLLQIVNEFIFILPEKFRNQKLIFMQKTLGIEEFPIREQFCLDLVSDSFYIAISSLYVRNYFKENSKNRAKELIRNIREEMKMSLEKVDWMDDYTRQGALKKLEAMKTLAAYPDELFDDQKLESYYESVEITIGKLFENIQKISTHAKNLSFNKLRKTTSEFDWMSDAGVTVANAFYNPGKNKIGILAGILQEPFFKSEWPDYMNYGGIGYVIGHEITHGFDSVGRKYDYEGNYKDWWNNKTAAGFEEKVKCKVDQYNNYTIKQIGKQINEKLTRGENIADAGGVKLAYHAYEKLMKTWKAAEECFPNLNYTPKQLFWISAATVWCEKATDGYLKHAIVEDPHNPGEASVNIVFSNNEDFAKDFEYPVGSMMNPTKKCQVW